MTEAKKEATTSQLWRKLFKSPSIDSYFEKNSGKYRELPTLTDYINDLCKRRDEKPERVLKRGDIETSYGHRIFAGGRNPSRDTVLQLAFGFEMDADEAQELLKIARYAPMHPRVKRDAVIAYCLNNHVSITQMQDYLYENGMPILGGRKHE